VLVRVGRVLLLGVLVGSFFRDPPFRGVGLVAGIFGLVVCVAALRLLFAYTREHRLRPALAVLAVLMALALTARWLGATTPALVVLCACAVVAMRRLPLAAAVPAMAVALGAYAFLADDRWLTTVVTTGGLALGGYVLRLDAEARGTSERLLKQERAALEAEAESAALAERARIAREIHDVLAHSLSAQLVHLEAARLLIERGAEREQILERVVAARGMARDGLAETRQALSALRGDLAPIEDYLRALAGDGTAGNRIDVETAGTPRPLPAEAGQAVRRVAQEALTNARKHAPGAAVRVRLEYGDGEVVLEIRDEGGRTQGAGLAASGAGYGLLGMRERAELLGGSLDAGADGEGFAVRLRVPA
jgi:signal transduction histidine kinase